ncbi:ABC transporter ATP-binding protein [Aestuariivirga litoralis]|uniref:ABC transporter ATP-binding protein n=1 Tax=Aestuariivirga litoralis TaxID=2650924 RepID=UPI0018C56688|nr:ABC transporter ATP-binding protein [Aestuariivirga litoralis]MBG1231452.1 ABC transporter ATP-binding protein [Aestuariivirga litoralis]
MSYLQLHNITKSYGQTQIVKGFDLDIAKGEFVSFLGPSGCGKTTVLRMVAGFEAPTSGSITIEGKDIVSLRASQRNIGLVFQAYALFPNMTVAKNVGFGLKVAGEKADVIEARVKEMLYLVGLSDKGDRYPFQLSGGQQQRVALARALAVRPRVLLLDEPLSALDAKIRVSLRKEIRDIQRSLGITTIFVTHDQEEALSISDRVVVMNAGIADQVGAPHEIYNRPKTKFVANFVGTLNSIPATIVDRKKSKLKVGEQKLNLQPILLSRHVGDTVNIAIRPESMRLGSRSDKDVSLDGTIEEVQFLGSVLRLRAKIDDTHVSLDTFNDPQMPPPALGQRVAMSFSPNDVIVLEE